VRSRCSHFPAAISRGLYACHRHIAAPTSADAPNHHSGVPSQISTPPTAASSSAHIVGARCAATSGRSR
jgi:hypothetical protein